MSDGRMPILCLDAGHAGRYNPGAVPGYYESEMNWKLCTMLHTALEDLGVKVLLTKPDLREDPSLTARGKMAGGADLFLSIHSNGASSTGPDYPLAICNVDGSSDEIGQALANKVQELMGTTQKGQILHRVASSGQGDWYTVLAASKAQGVPGVILEHSFHTNPRACAWLMNDGNLRLLAEKEAKIIADYFQVKEHLYRVRKSWQDSKSQIGAYKILENAVRACKDGFTVYDEDGNAVYSKAYTLTDFIKDVQSACGAKVDGIAGPETLTKTVTISASINNCHPAVKAVQKRLSGLGYIEVGEADGIAGPKFTAAVKNYQAAGGGAVDGEITARQRTWKRLLGVKA